MSSKIGTKSSLLLINTGICLTPFCGLFWSIITSGLLLLVVAFLLPDLSFPSLLELDCFLLLESGGVITISASIEK